MYNLFNPLGSSLPGIQSQLQTISQYIMEANDTYNTMKDVDHPQILADSETVGDIISNTTLSVMDTTVIIEEANRTVVDALDEFYERSDLLNEAQSVSDSLGMGLSELSTNITNLLIKLQEAEAAAASVSMGVVCMWVWFRYGCGLDTGRVCLPNSS